MKIMKKVIIKLCAVIIFMLPGLCIANFIEDAWSIATDPFKLGKASENTLLSVREARDAIIALDGLREKTDENIKYYLQDFDNKIKLLENASKSVVTHTVSELKGLEKQVISDVSKIIRETECAVIRVADDALNTSLRDTLPSFLKGNKRVVQLPFGERRKLFFFKEPITVEVDLSKSPNPDDIFYTIEKAALENLNKASDDSSARKIVGVYGNLARLAKKTQCFYEGQQYENKFAKKYAKYNAMVFAWNKSVNYGG